MANQQKIAWLIVRLGVAFCFIYAAVAGYLDPESWIGWFPKFMRDMIPELILLKIWGVYEFITGVWILSGKKIFIPSVLASLSLAGLILANFSAMDVIFRDVTILFSTIALAVESFPNKTIEQQTKQVNL